MSTHETIDARGLSCPEPVLLTQEALRERKGAGFVVLVSSPTAKDNVGRVLDGAKRLFTVSPDGEGWRFEVVPE